MDPKDLETRLATLERRLAKFETGTLTRLPVELIDLAGAPALTLTAGPEGPVLTLWNPSGEPAIELVAGHQAMVTLFSECERVLMMKGLPGGAKIELRTPGKSATVELTATAESAALYLGGDHLDGHVSVQTLGDGAEINVWREPTGETVSMEAGVLGTAVKFSQR